ncbi:MAG: hypothetical protein RIS47_445 [Bacteroidota bacterium]
MKTQDIEISQYDYPLAEENIARYPLDKRDASKLLVYRPNTDILCKKFDHLPGLIPSDSLLVFNNTKVIRARIAFAKETGAQIEVFCLEPITPNDYQLAFQQREACTWKCIVGNAKRWKSGALQCVMPDTNGEILSVWQVEKFQDGSYILKFSWLNTERTFAEIIERVGHTPIPPYLNRKSEAIDTERYQTVYSKTKGSVAAPTAGLHFTPNVLEEIAARGIRSTELTLHVGAGTFKPVSTQTIGAHEMHSEHFYFTVAQLEMLCEFAGRIIPVGTTSLRSIESIYWLGVMVLVNPLLQPENLVVSQWLPYQYSPEYSATESLTALIEYMHQHKLDFVEAQTQILIAPPYQSKLIRAIITNFHQPKSTLLVLISALIGQQWNAVYEYALANNFRFLSYGDSSLLFVS